MLDVVQQAARRGDNDFDTTAQLGDLRVHVHATVHGGGTQGQVFGVRLGIHANLVSQLARGRQDQRTHRVHGRRDAGVGKLFQTLQDRQQESGSLAGTGLGGSQQIAAGQDQRDGLGLDGGSFRVPHFVDGTQDFRCQA